jgi:hypothetical protein
VGQATNIFVITIKKYTSMRPNTTADNKIFNYAILGVLLFVAAMGFTVTHFSSIAMLQLSYTLVAAALVTASLSLLFKAIKNDRYRVKMAE